MGCKRLLVEPWALKIGAMAQEFLQARSNELEGTIQRDPEWQTADSWVEVYRFRKEGRGIAGRTDKLTEDKFRTTINPKDRHTIGD